MGDTSASASQIFAQISNDQAAASDLKRQLMHEKAQFNKQKALLQ